MEDGKTRELYRCREVAFQFFMQKPIRVSKSRRVIVHTRRVRARIGGLQAPTEYLRRSPVHTLRVFPFGRTSLSFSHFECCCMTPDDFQKNQSVSSEIDGNGWPRLKKLHQ